jgi:hypothetical protein
MLLTKLKILRKIFAFTLFLFKLKYANIDAYDPRMMCV